jgi:hypothetical protein
MRNERLMIDHNRLGKKKVINTDVEAAIDIICLNICHGTIAFEPVSN